jgi:hypothetical protein
MKVINFKFTPANISLAINSRGGESESNNFVELNLMLKCFFFVNGKREEKNKKNLGHESDVTVEFFIVLGR